MKILLTDSHALGDAVEDIIAAWHLHRTHPEHQVNLDLGCFNPLTDNIGWLDRTVTRGNADKVIPIEMPLIHRSNQNCVHVVTAITRHLETCLDCRIATLDMKFPAELTEEEKSPALQRRLGLPDEGYWLIDAGCKEDFTVKHWGTANWQSVVNRTRHKVTWAQIGLSGHRHAPLKGAVSCLDKTENLRDLLSLYYRAAGVLTPVSSPLHLGTMPWHGHEGKYRPVVVVAGGREPVSFTTYPGQHRFHALGMMDCCMTGGCWRAKVCTGGEKGCLHPEKCGDEHIAGCMALITPAEVAARVLLLAGR